MNDLLDLAFIIPYLFFSLWTNNYHFSLEGRLLIKILIKMKKKTKRKMITLLIQDILELYP